MKKLAIKISILVVTILVPLASYNYATDYYGVFNKELENRYNEPNMRFIKTQYILENPDKFNTFIFGSSRTGKVLAHLKDPNVYNMYYSDGLPVEFFEDLTTFIANEVSIKKVYIGLDEFSFKIIPSKHHSQLLRKRYCGSFSDDIANYILYLIDPPKLNTVPFSVATTFDYKNTGCPLHFEVDSIINKNPEKHINDPKFNNPVNYIGNRTTATITEIQQIINLCKKREIELAFFFNPVFAKTYTQYTTEELSNIKKSLARITSFYDFSGITSITTNPLNYYESSHYRYFVGDSIWSVIKTGDESKDFVTLVTNGNIDGYLKEEQQEVMKFLENRSLELYDP